MTLNHAPQGDHFTPRVGLRVQCTISPNSDDSLDAGEIVRVMRQRYTADLVQIAWDPGVVGRSRDRDWYSTDILRLERAQVIA